MPREYRQSTGKPGPSPGGFGSADLNLQNPRFVAQTNVAVPENPFETLQKVLGLGVDIFSQTQKIQAAEIEGKINYEKALQVKAERDADAWKSKERLRIAQAKTPEEAKKLESEYLAGANDEESPAQQRIRAELIETAESEGRQIASEIRLQKSEQEQALFDEIVAIKAKGADSINSAYEAGDIEGLAALRRGFATQAQQSSGRSAAVYQDLRETTTGKIEKLEGELEVKNRMAANAAAAAAADMTQQAARPILDGMLENIEAVALNMREVSGESLGKALMDHTRDRITSSNPNIAAAFANGSDQEIAAINETLFKETHRVVERITAIRNADNMQRSRETKISYFGLMASVAADSSGVGDLIDEISSDFDLTDPQKATAYREVAVKYIGGGTTGIDQLRRANELRRSDNSVIAAKSAAIMNGLIGDQMKILSAERQALIKTNAAESDADAPGWDSRFNSKKEFIEHALLGFGTTYGSLNDPTFPEPLFAAMAELGRQYDADAEKTRIKNNRIEAEARRADADKRKAMKVEDIWDQSPLSAALRSGSYRTMGQHELRTMMRDSLVGYANVSVPKELADFAIDGFDNPDNFTLVKTFWSVFNSSIDPAARNQMLKDGKYRMSSAVGAALVYLDYDREVSGEQTIKTVQEFASNLIAYDQPNEGSAEALQQRRTIDDTVAVLAMGAGIDTGIFDATGLEPNEVFGKLSPVDQSTIRMHAVAAANWPNAGDRNALMSKMMKQDGYRIYRFSTDGGPSYKLIQNVRGRSGTIAFPNPDIVDSQRYRDYLMSKKEQAAVALSSMRQLDVDGRPVKFTADNIKDVRIAPYDMDIRDGYSAVQVYVGNRWINLDTTKVRVTLEDYHDYVSSNPQKPKPDITPGYKAAALSGM